MNFKPCIDVFCVNSFVSSPIELDFFIFSVGFRSTKLKFISLDWAVWGNCN